MGGNNSTLSPTQKILFCKILAKEQNLDMTDTDTPAVQKAIASIKYKLTPAQLALFENILEKGFFTKYPHDPNNTINKTTEVKIHEGILHRFSESRIRKPMSVDEKEVLERIGNALYGSSFGSKLELYLSSRGGGRRTRRKKRSRTRSRRRRV